MTVEGYFHVGSTLTQEGVQALWKGLTPALVRQAGCFHVWSALGSHTYRPCATVLRAIFLLVGILCGILCILWTQPRPLTAVNWVSNCWVKLKCRVWSSIHNSSALFSALPSGRPETTCSKAICLLKLQRTLFGQSETRRKDLFLLQFWSSLFPSLWSAVKEMFP